MPICYQIEIEIERVEGGEPVRTTRLPGKIPQDAEVSPERLRELVNEFFADFMNMITGYDPSRAGQYRDTGRFAIIAVFPC